MATWKELTDVCWCYEVVLLSSGMDLSLLERVQSALTIVDGALP